MKKKMNHLIELNRTELIKVQGGSCEGGSNWSVGCAIAKFHNWVDRATTRHVKRVASTDPSLLVD